MEKGDPISVLKGALHGESHLLQGELRRGKVFLRGKGSAALLLKVAERRNCKKKKNRNQVFVRTRSREGASKPAKERKGSRILVKGGGVGLIATALLLRGRDGSKGRFRRKKGLRSSSGAGRKKLGRTSTRGAGTRKGGWILVYFQKERNLHGGGELRPR